ncbi:MAG TPA: hypothetical protein VGC41_07655, partial [Kofleriaceae bacterium]
PAGGAFTLAAQDVEPAAYGRAGTFTIELAFLSQTPIALTLIGARASLRDPKTLDLGGGISTTEVDSVLYPAYVAELQAYVNADCAALNLPPACGCASGSTGQLVVMQYDKNQNCFITKDELQANAAFSSLLAPDVTIEGQKALSLGVQLAIEPASF